MMTGNDAWMNCIEKDLPGVNGVTKTMQNAVAKQSRKIRGSVRAMMARVMTSEEMAERRSLALHRSLKPAY